MMATVAERIVARRAARKRSVIEVGLDQLPQRRVSVSLAAIASLFERSTSSRSIYATWTPDSSGKVWRILLFESREAAIAYRKRMRMARFFMIPVRIWSDGGSLRLTAPSRGGKVKN